jgi:uncharacterized membrane protein
MRQLVIYFFRGLVLVAPVALTVYVCVWLFVHVDSWLGLPVPGAGFLLTVAAITAAGFLASNLFTRGAVALLDRVLDRLPFVRLVYSSTRDLVKAVVGEQRRFDKPVLVQLFAGGPAHVLGFVTQESLAELDRSDFVAVYVPQSYHWAGQVYVFPAAAVQRLPTPSSSLLAFIVSGGVTQLRNPQGETRLSEEAQ